MSRSRFLNIVRRYTAPGFKFGDTGFCVIGVPIFIRINKNKIEEPWKLIHQLVGIGKPRINIIAETRLLEIR